MRRTIAVLAAASMMGGASLTAAPVVAVSETGAAAEAPGELELVGHEPLGMRGMNAALAVHGDYAYVGSRTDAKPPEVGLPENVNGAGVLVVDVSDPEKPEVVHEIGPPHQGNEGETSREMRVWPQQELLIVQNLGSNCSALIHACSPRSVDDNFRFYDISGEKAAAPELVAEYQPSLDPHEFFLWVDPHDPARALIFATAHGPRRLVVADISQAREGTVTEIGAFPTGVRSGGFHSVALSNDGTRAYLSHLTGGMAVADTSEIVAGLPDAELHLVSARPATWEGVGPHSGVKLYGRDYVLTTDEVYGDALKALGHGCPWGWSRLVGVADETAPAVVAEYKLPSGHNEASFCQTDAPRPSSSYSSHNPTVTDNLAFISWHSGGLQAVDISDPAAPSQVAEFVPGIGERPAFVLQEDPALSAGQDKVVMWSYPIIKDGLIYVADVRNGLYILKYKGPFEEEVESISFIEGNSNLGDALRFEPVPPPEPEPEPEPAA